MIKKLLLALGLSKAPPPVRSYLAVSSFVGVVPALAYVTWKNRKRILPLLDRVRALSTGAESTRAATPA